MGVEVGAGVEIEEAESMAEVGMLFDEAIVVIGRLRLILYVMMRMKRRLSVGRRESSVYVRQGSNGVYFEGAWVLVWSV